MELPSALSIAGSDNSGGAGIQADLKAFSANGVYGQTAIVALVDECTQGVYSIHKVPTEFVCNQIRTCLNDIGADAIKIGMLDDANVVRAVAATLGEYKGSKATNNIVLDPVMVSTSGHKLLEDSAIDVLKSDLIPIARIITPNIPEAELLLGRKINNQSEFADCARELSKLGNCSVFLKAGHLVGEKTIIDYFYDAENDEMLELPSEKIDTKNTHGTGCTLSSTLAAQLAKGKSLQDAAKLSKAYISGAIAAAQNLKIGEGHGPVHHFYQLW